MVDHLTGSWFAAPAGHVQSGDDELGSEMIGDGPADYPPGPGVLEQVIKNFPAAFAEFGILLERIEPAIIGGWTSSRVVPVVASHAGRGRPNPLLPGC